MALLGALSIGIFVLPVALLATWYLARRDRSARAVSGGLSGIGLPLLYVAAMNREGPGVVCRGQACGQQWSPWPWLVAGVLFVLLGLAAYVLSELRRRSR
jgi:hypothetical protein